MTSSRLSALLLPLLVGSTVGTTACSDDDPDPQATPDAPVAPPDAPTSGCDPATVLPNNYRPIAMTSNGTVAVTTNAEITSGTIDATAGGLMNAADNPYIYVDLRGGTKVELDDLAARSSADWDLALKRSSLRINGGDSGPGERTLAVVTAPTLAAASAPASGYTTDDFADEDCMLKSLPGGEPSSAFGEWYDYDPMTHVITPKGEVYVIERADGTRTAFRIDSYYGDPASPMRGAFYRVEWKALAPRS